ncbi:MAG TPA: alpha/beta hydrolase [bacterium]|nr:alpha/beta hydrolase [bacterium]
MKISVRGVELAYETLGSGPPYVLVHGGPGMGHPDRIGAYRRLAGRVRLIAYEHRGHGASGRAPAHTYTIADQAEDLHALIQALRLERPIVGGTSAGGFASLLYATRYPSEPRALVLIGTAPSGGFMARATANAERQGSPEVIAAYRRLWDGSLTDPAGFQRDFETIQPLYYYDKTRAPTSLAGRSFDPETRRALIRDYATYDVRAALASIAVPTFIGVGRHDWICPVEESVEIARLMPQAELHVFEQSGHSPQTEEPEALFEALSQFLDRVV